jgi:flavin-dependent dehydrogenase
VTARGLIGADGARSAVARQAVKNADKVPCVFAYHEIVKAPEPADTAADYEPTRCDVYYQGRVSPDFYGWVFPHGKHASIGVGSANKGFSLRGATRTLRETAGLENAETVRREGAPIPLKPLKKWDDGAMFSLPVMRRALSHRPRAKGSITPWKAVGWPGWQRRGSWRPAMHARLPVRAGPS